MTYTLNQVRDIRDQVLHDESIVMSDEACAGIVDSSLTSGHVRFEFSKGWPVLLRCTLSGCQIEAVKPIKNMQFLRARFINCTFKGKLKGVDFGRLLKSSSSEDFGAIEECDFTQATLDECRFWNVDVSSMKFPGWPHVVIREPKKRAADIASVIWPEGLAPYMKIVGEELSAAVLLHMPSVLKHVKRLKRPPFTLEEAKAAFEQLGGVGL